METYPKYYPLPKGDKDKYTQKTTLHWVGVVFWLVPKKCAIKNFKLPPYSSLFPPPLGKHVLQAMETSKERFIIAPQLLDVLRLLLGKKRGPQRHQSQGRKLQGWFKKNTTGKPNKLVLGCVWCRFFMHFFFKGALDEVRWGVQVLLLLQVFQELQLLLNRNSRLEPESQKAEGKPIPSIGLIYSPTFATKINQM